MARTPVARDVGWRGQPDVAPGCQPFEQKPIRLGPSWKEPIIEDVLMDVDEQASSLCGHSVDERAEQRLSLSGWIEVCAAEDLIVHPASRQLERREIATQGRVEWKERPGRRAAPSEVPIECQRRVVREARSFVLPKRVHRVGRQQPPVVMPSANDLGSRSLFKRALFREHAVRPFAGRVTDMQSDLEPLVLQFAEESLKACQ